MTAGKHDTMVTVAREKRQAEYETYLRRMMKRFNKELLEDTHKVGVHVCVSVCSRFFYMYSRALTLVLAESRIYAWTG